MWGQYCFIPSLMTWLMGQSTDLASLKTTQNSGTCWHTRWVYCHPWGGGGQGGGLSRLTKHADRNLMKFKGKRKVLPQGRSNSMHQGRLEARWLESSFAENVLRVLVDEAVSPCSKQTNTILGCRRSIRLWNPNLLYEDPSISLAGVQC